MQFIQPIAQNFTYDSDPEILRKAIALELEEIDKSDRILVTYKYFFVSFF